MDIILFQDLVTVNSSAVYGVATQGADSWLDIGNYEDVVLHVDLKSCSVVGSAFTAAIFNFQTAPAKEDAAFRNMFSQVKNDLGTPGVGVELPVGVTSVQPLLVAYTTVPPAKYLRWQLVPLAEGPVFTTATFRIFITAYAC